MIILRGISMRLKALPFLFALVTLSSVNSYAACSSPAGKTFSGHFDDLLFYQNTSQTSMSLIWGRRWAVRMTFNATGSTVTMTGYGMAGGDGGSELSINTTTSTYKATWTFNSATCSGTLVVGPRTSATTNNTYNIHYQVASSGTVINTVNKNTPSAVFTQPSGGTNTLVGGGTFWQE
jgi:hypothetical protein